MVSPLRGNAWPGRKFQRVRSAESKSNVACWRWSGVRLSRKDAAAVRIAVADRSAAMTAPATSATTEVTASRIRGARRSRIGDLLSELRGFYLTRDREFWHLIIWLLG